MDRQVECRCPHCKQTFKLLLGPWGESVVADVSEGNKMGKSRGPTKAPQNAGLLHRLRHYTATTIGGKLLQENAAKNRGDDSLMHYPPNAPQRREDDTCDD